MKSLLLIAQHLCHYHGAVAIEKDDAASSATEEGLSECVLELCKMITLPLNVSSNICSIILPHLPLDHARTMAVLAVPGEDILAKDALKFNRDLLSAAAWMGDEMLVAKLLADGYNWFSAP